MIKRLIQKSASSLFLSHNVRKIHTEEIHNIGSNAYDWFLTRDANYKDMKAVRNILDKQKWAKVEELADLDCTYTDYKKGDVIIELHSNNYVGISLTATGNGSKESLESIKAEIEKLNIKV